MFVSQARILVLVAAVFLAVLPQVAVADTRLIMVTSDHCPFCRAWERDVGTVYSKSPYAPNLPLTRIAMGHGLPENVVLQAPIVGTPTFIVLRDGREIDRQRGYEDAEMFWWWLSDHAAE